MILFARNVDFYLGETACLLAMEAQVFDRPEDMASKPKGNSGAGIEERGRGGEGGGGKRNLVV